MRCGEEKKEKEKKEEEKTTYIKSNNPQLAGGEKSQMIKASQEAGTAKRTESHVATSLWSSRPPRRPAPAEERLTADTAAGGRIAANKAS